MSIGSLRRYKQREYYNNKNKGICVYCKKVEPAKGKSGCRECLDTLAKIKRKKYIKK